jgi:hypothetical protein
MSHKNLSSGSYTEAHVVVIFRQVVVGTAVTITHNCMITFATVVPAVSKLNLLQEFACGTLQHRTRKVYTRRVYASNNVNSFNIWWHANTTHKQWLAPVSSLRTCCTFMWHVYTCVAEHCVAHTATSLLLRRKVRVSEADRIDEPRHVACHPLVASQVLMSLLQTQCSVLCRACGPQTLWRGVLEFEPLNVHSPCSARSLTLSRSRNPCMYICTISCGWHFQRSACCARCSECAFVLSTKHGRMQQKPTFIPADNLDCELMPTAFLGKCHGFSSHMSREQMEERQRRAAARWLTPEMIEVNERLRAKYAREQARARWLRVLGTAGAVVAAGALLYCMLAVLWHQPFISQVCPLPCA